MKPFDLEKAKAGAPLVDSQGDIHKFVAYEPDAKNGSVVATFNMTRLVWSGFKADGSQNDFSNRRLFLADPPKVKKSGWINVYRNGQTSNVLPTKEAAESIPPNWFRVATIEIHWEEEAV